MWESNLLMQNNIFTLSYFYVTSYTNVFQTFFRLVMNSGYKLQHIINTPAELYKYHNTCK